MAKPKGKAAASKTAPAPRMAGSPETAKLTVLVVAAALTVLTGADYSLRARGLARAAEPSRAEPHRGREG